MKRLLIFICFIFLWMPSNAITRFEKEQLEFSLYVEGLPTVLCHHVPLKESGPFAPDLPWWSVSCESRMFTVDAWYEKTFLPDQLMSVRLMFHIKESTDSSGFKNTQFNTHTTDFITDRTHLYGVSSFLDVGNGLADLRVIARTTP